MNGAVGEVDVRRMSRDRAITASLASAECVTHSYFNSAFITVADALRTGNCTLISKAMEHKVLMDEKVNRASGVLYAD
jgi:hypothetical protein